MCALRNSLIRILSFPYRGSSHRKEIMSSGELGRRVSTKVNTIRFYEEIGLLPAAERSASGRRRLTQLHLQRLRFVRNARSLGFSTNEIRSLLSLADQPEKDRKSTRLNSSH